VGRIRLRAFPYDEIRAIETKQDFSDLLARRGLESYASLVGARGLGDALAVCATETEARQFRGFGFDRVTLTGVVPPSKVEPAMARDERFTYRLENAEALTFPANSFDLVFCKEGLHHLARPVLGLYEMLRVCRRAAIVIEPYESRLGRMLERLGLASVYERRGSSFHVDASDRIVTRDNYVFRWTSRGIECLLESYYLDSGYQLDITRGWLSKRANAHRLGGVRFVAAIGGAAASHVPGAEGNVMVALIVPGTDEPTAPRPFPHGDEVGSVIQIPDLELDTGPTED
jgi:SAM-dependent methyltransferase